VRHGARVTSQVIYASAYTSTQTQVGDTQSLASTLVVHNVDPDAAITVVAINYFDRNGKRYAVMSKLLSSLAHFRRPAQRSLCEKMSRGLAPIF